MSEAVIILALCFGLTMLGLAFAFGFAMGIAAAMDVCAPPVTESVPEEEK